MREQIVWELTAKEDPFEASALQEDISVDACVVGAGITGLSTALHLAEKGLSVCVLEAHEVARGGSGRNVGLVNPGLWIPPEDIISALGEEEGERANRVLGAATETVFGLIDRFDIACDATTNGTLHCAHNQAGVKELERRHRQFTERGYPVELLTGSECRGYTGMSQVPAALLDRRAGTINPLAYTRGLARAAATKGVSIFQRSAVTQLERASSQWQVSTRQAMVKANSVILSTNAYTEEGWNEVKNHFFPGHFYQVASEPLAKPDAQSILPENQGSWDTRTVLSSIRKDCEGRLILGSLGRGETKPQAFVKTWANRIQKHYFPNLEGIKWEMTWTGRIGFTPDHMIRVFSPAPELYAISGYNGRGITTGSVIGKGLSELISQGTDEYLPVPVKPVDPITGIPLRQLAYETGFTLYHAGQCLKILI